MLSSCSTPQIFFPHPNKSFDYFRVSVQIGSKISWLLMVNQTHFRSKALLSATLEPADWLQTKLPCDSEEGRW